MWISKAHAKVLDNIIHEQKDEMSRLRSDIIDFRIKDGVAGAVLIEKVTQKAKDDITIDWMRHRINALEKEKASLLVARGIAVSVPEIVIARPGTMSAPPEFGSMPTFEDVGDDAAKKFGLAHDEEGHLVLGMPESLK